MHQRKQASAEIVTVQRWDVGNRFNGFAAHRLSLASGSRAPKRQATIVSDSTHEVGCAASTRGLQTLHVFFACVVICCVRMCKTNDDVRYSSHSAGFFHPVRMWYCLKAEVIHGAKGLPQVGDSIRVRLGALVVSLVSLLFGEVPQE